MIVSIKVNSLLGTWFSTSFKTCWKAGMTCIFTKSGRKENNGLKNETLKNERYLLKLNLDCWWNFKSSSFFNFENRTILCWVIAISGLCCNPSHLANPCFDLSHSRNTPKYAANLMFLSTFEDRCFTFL